VPIKERSPGPHGARPTTEGNVFGTILHRMILWELLKVFLISLLGITGILLMAGILAEASQQGLGPGQILAAIPLLVPCMLPYTIPATTLFATCVVYGRLAADNEILAIKSAGINVLKVIQPGLILGLAMSGVTLGLYYHIIPYTHRLLRALIFSDAEEFVYSILKKQGMINYSQLHYSLFVQGVRGKTLLSPVIKRKDNQGMIEAVAMAQEAELRVDLPHNQLLLRMTNGVTSTADNSQAYFQEHTFEVPLPKDFGAEGQRRPRGMTWPEILQRRTELVEDKGRLTALLAVSMAQMLLGDVPWFYREQFRPLEDHERSNRLAQVELDVELLMRPALSLGCLCFILIGCPVGIWFCRSDFLSSFITCFLPIVFVYYPLMLCGTGMAKEGRLAPIPLVYGPDVLVGALGLVLFWRLLKN
jgi:lipopolysaccharide export system permease protein